MLLYYIVVMFNYSFPDDDRTADGRVVLDVTSGTLEENKGKEGWIAAVEMKYTFMMSARL